MPKRNAALTLFSITAIVIALLAFFGPEAGSLPRWVLASDLAGLAALTLTAAYL